jgi:TRAP-type C4-dicarboxylate transport system permease small subunit
MRALNDWIYAVLRVVLTALIAIMVVPVTIQIASRFVDAIPRYIWTEEVARFCLIWLIMLGATAAVRDGTHFDVDVLPEPKTNRGRALGKLVVHVGILLMAITFIVFGWGFANFGAIQESELTGMSMLWIYIAWPLAGVIWVLFTLEHIQDDLRLYAKGRDEPA